MEGHENGKYSYYNPFDFVEQNEIIPKRVSIDNRKESVDFRMKKHESLIQINPNVRIHHEAEENDLLVVTKNNVNVGEIDMKDSTIKPDSGDKIQPLKFFKLKIEDFSGLKKIHDET